MTLGEFVGAVNKGFYVNIELRNAKNTKICTCKDNSPVIWVYGKCEVIDWWSEVIDGRVIVRIDDSEAMRCVVGDVEE